jgi:sucrose-6-phosphate hydrolase SacC (GH32 family)
VNDPNGLFFDEVHSMYHFMYQNGLFEPADGHGQGPVWGHAVSRDLIKWAHLDVSIWNDRLYDERAIFTGSATVVNGKPYLVYPGLCVKGRQPDCNSGTVLALAVPANDSDPFYTEWKKLDALNPIVNNTGRDPTTAWLTDAGEWRMVTYDKQLHVSTDFLHWTNPGASALPSGECPSLFPLPRRYNDNDGDTEETALDPRMRSDATPTHVFKHSYNPPGPDQGQDVMLVGTWVDGARGTTGNWTPYKPNASEYASIGQVIDNGYTYASKVSDPKCCRRLSVPKCCRRFLA